MCQLNLDAFQSATNKHFKTDFEIPVLYFTQLMGLAFGIDAKQLGFGQEFVSARRALAKIGTEIEPSENGKPPRKKDEGLPMPQMTGGGSK
jgi:heterodisulfide reductase subunit B